MKKIFVVLLFSFALISVSAFSQLNMKATSMMQNMHQQLKDSVGLSDAQADSVVVIRQAFMPQFREAMSETGSAKEDKLKAVKEAENSRISKVLSPEQMTKLDAYMKNMMQQRMMKHPQQSTGGNN